jgi:hypothetical protein
MDLAPASATSRMMWIGTGAVMLRAASACSGSLTTMSRSAGSPGATASSFSSSVNVETIATDEPLSRAIAPI